MVAFHDKLDARCVAILPATPRVQVVIAQRRQARSEHPSQELTRHFHISAPLQTAFFPGAIIASSSSRVELSHRQNRNTKKPRRPLPTSKPASSRLRPYPHPHTTVPDDHPLSATGLHARQIVIITRSINVLIFMSRSCSRPGIGYATEIEQRTFC